MLDPIKNNQHWIQTRVQNFLLAIENEIPDWGDGVWKFGAQFCKDGVPMWCNKRIWILVNKRTLQNIYMYKKS